MKPITEAIVIAKKSNRHYYYDEDGVWYESIIPKLYGVNDDFANLPYDAVIERVKLIKAEILEDEDGELMEVGSYKIIKKTNQL